MKGIIWVLVLLLVACGNKDGGGENTACTISDDCIRGKACVDKKCKKVECAGHAECAKVYKNTICVTGLTPPDPSVEVSDFCSFDPYGYEECWLANSPDDPSVGVCSSIECGAQFGECAAGTECANFICIPAKAQCTTSSECKQPAEKCYSGQCMLANYCELDEDCPSNQCNTEASACTPLPQGDVTEFKGDEEDVYDCDPADFEGPLSYLCAPCSNDGDCGCGQGVCTEIGEETFCSLACEALVDCPSGYKCMSDFCKPMGGACKGCIQPPNCEMADGACNFKTGECQAKVDWCLPCTFDYECGFGNRCHLTEKQEVFCAPECDAETFSCPLGSGCEIRDDGLMICVYNGSTCCYGLGCEETCFCEQPTPVCDQDGQCVQCLVNAQCPPGKPMCDQTTNTCMIQCMPPNGVYWVDPETNLEYCIECAKSKDCPAGYLCGTFKNDPETYHMCYPAPE